MDADFNSYFSLVKQKDGTLSSIQGNSLDVTLTDENLKRDDIIS